MGFFRWLRRFVGGGSAQPVARLKRVMHLLGPGYRPRCGADWTPASPLTVELGMVECERCIWLGQRDRLQRRATRR